MTDTTQPEALRIADDVDEVARTYPDMAEVSAELRRQHAENARLAALVGTQQPAPSAAAAITDTEAFQNFHRLLCARFGYVHDESDWRRDQLSLVEHIARQAQPSPAPQADSQPAPVLDMAVMQLAESVGLIGPASRVHDLHAAIQRFHDLICVNATIKAAVMAADVISGAAMPDLQDAAALLRKYRKLCQEVGRGDSAHLDRIETAAVAVQTVAARAPADSGAAGIEAAAKLLERKADDFAREHGSDDLGGLSFGRGAHADAKLEYHSTLLELAEEIRSLTPTPPAQTADSVLEDAASAGFFLQLPQRPKPEAPARTVGLDWDAYSGAQMLAYGRDCSNAAIVAAQKPGGL